MMNNSFESMLVGRAINRGGLLLYRPNDAIELIDLCRQNKIKILGIDAFFISDGYTHPLIEHSIDLSNTDASTGNEIAYKFLESRKDFDLVYEIVY